MAQKRLGTDIRQDPIAEATLDIVRFRGIRSLNVAAVAEKVGIVPSTVSRHFKNHCEIVSAVLQLIQTRLNVHFQDVVKLGIQLFEKLQLLLNRPIELISRNYAIPRIIFSEEVPGGMPEKQQQLYDIFREAIRKGAD